jgi:hypothetical protein
MIIYVLKFMDINISNVPKQHMLEPVSLNLCGMTGI